MFVGSFHAGALARTGVSHPVSGTAPQSTGETDGERVDPAYQRTISSISPGSYAAAYQAIRTVENASAIMPAPEADQDAAIHSGAGIPAALGAYREFIDAE